MEIVLSFLETLLSMVEWQNVILLEKSFTSCEIELLIGEVLEMLDAYRQVKGKKWQNLVPKVELEQSWHISWKGT